VTGNIAGIWGDGNNTFSILSPTMPPAISGATIQPTASHYYQNGWLKIGTGTDAIVMGITGSAYYAGSPNQIHFNLDSNLTLDMIGLPVEVYPGCDGSVTSCKGKFNRFTRYGGFAYAPDYIVNRPATQSTGK
jgi:hypothetical protein